MHNGEVVGLVNLNAGDNSGEIATHVLGKSAVCNYILYFTVTLSSNVLFSAISINALFSVYVRFNRTLTNLYIFYLTVFYIRTVAHEISMPIAWYPTTTTPAGVLAMKFWKLVFACEARNLHIYAVIADGLATNRQFFKLVSKCDAKRLDKPYVAPNPVCDHNIYLCSDPSHLLKVGVISKLDIDLLALLFRKIQFYKSYFYCFLPRRHAARQITNFVLYHYFRIFVTLCMRPDQVAQGTYI